ncbi:hypothetical protein G9U51_13935 [Calidifontibacter sp. DB0510]|uniref:Uncharacterized protein n=1 Tax=Metallococcus carri TaxID=1656884 RepID=A0A967B224_9MICO|nr:hypothetical protein [Metallococcus carri]NHN56873.1 hypothetical protein [Metallococcus carri]NOP37618.1 hypothetical protein [Calidifontibacter sp. DB2511S]
MTNEGDFGETELDPQERLDAQINLDDPQDSDDEPWTPPERQPRGSEFIGLEEEGETIDQRIAQEEPEEGTAYGQPGPEDQFADPEQQDMEGGDDPDAIPADQDVLGGESYAAEVDEEFTTDDTAPAEEQALHYDEE